MDGGRWSQAKRMTLYFILFVFSSLLQFTAKVFFLIKTIKVFLMPHGIVGE